MKKKWGILLAIAVAAFIVLIGIQFLDKSPASSGRPAEPVAESTDSAATVASDPEEEPGLRRVYAIANYMAYPTLDALEAHADVIVIGTPLLPFEERRNSSSYYDDGELQDFYTLTEFTVDTVIKDEGPRPVADSGSVAFVEPLGIKKQADGSEVILSMSGYREAAFGKRYIVFLADNGQGEYSIINMTSGKFSPDMEQAEELEELEPTQREIHIRLRAQVFAKYEEQLE